MLRVTIPASEQWDEGKQEFVNTKEQTLSLEHSLVSLSKWESRWCKPFFGKGQFTDAETIDYIRCMTLTQNVPEEVYNVIPESVIEEITEYINAPMTATWFSEEAKKGNKKSSETVTSELIYYWMIALQIPPEYQKWHLNRLMTLIQVCNVKNAPQKKMSKGDIMRQNKALNDARRKKFNSRG